MKKVSDKRLKELSTPMAGGTSATPDERMSMAQELQLQRKLEESVRTAYEETTPLFNSKTVESLTDLDNMEQE